MKRISHRILGWLSACGLALLTGSLAADEIPVGGHLMGKVEWKSTNTYILTNFTYVLAGAELHIEPGTVIKGAPGTGGGGAGQGKNDFGCLFVCRGGKIFAEGEPNNPIIFTAEEDDVNDSEDLPFPTRGRWGGIVLFGNARINNAGFTAEPVGYDIYEGLPDDTHPTTGEHLHRFGGSNDDDSSGVLRYVSIRHGGKLLTTDKEVNGLSLGGVGRGTTVEYVETYCIADDGFEFFGGSVNTKYLISAFNDDDAFDTDEGYNGKNQFWFAIQEPGKRDEGSEQNGQPNSPDVVLSGAEPRSSYQVYNATFIGAGTTGSGNDALNIRRENFCAWHNSIFTEFQGKRVDIDSTSQPSVTHNLFWAFGAGDGAAGNGTGYGTAFAPAELNPIADPQLAGISRAQDGGLDPRPAPAGPAYSGLKDPTDPFFAKVAFKGAFGAGNWALDWTALGNNGVFKAVPPATETVVSGGGITISATPPAAFGDVSLLTNIVHDEAAKTITADLPTDQSKPGFLVITPAVTVSGVTVEGGKLTVKYQ